MRSTQSLQLAKTALAALSVAGLLASAPAFAVPSMNIQVDGGGPNGTIATGETVTVSLYGNDIPVGGGAPNDGLFGFGFAITFNDSILDSSAAIAGPLWVGTGFTTSHNDPGDVGMTAFAETVANGSMAKLTWVNMSGNRGDVAPVNAACGARGITSDT